MLCLFISLLKHLIWTSNKTIRYGLYSTYYNNMFIVRFLFPQCLVMMVLKKDIIMTLVWLHYKLQRCVLFKLYCTIVRKFRNWDWTCLMVIHQWEDFQLYRLLELIRYFHKFFSYNLWSFTNRNHKLYDENMWY